MKNLPYLFLSLIIIALDQFSKYYAVQYLNFQEPVYLTSFFNLYLDHNFGAAFSFLKSAGGWQIWIFGAIALLVSLWIMMYLLKTENINKSTAIGFSFILGGALGNLIDRISHGYVIDFISWHYHHYYWPTFNIADSAVCMGVVLLFLGMKKSG